MSTPVTTSTTTPTPAEGDVSAGPAVLVVLTISVGQEVRSFTAEGLPYDGSPYLLARYISSGVCEGAHKWLQAGEDAEDGEGK